MVLPKKKKAHTGHEPVGYLFIAPFYLFFLVIILLPIVIAIFNSFTNYDLYRSSDFIGLSNYKTLLKDPLFKKALVNTLVYSVLYIIPSMTLGLLLALLVSGESRRYQVFRTGFYMPYIISMVCASTIWLWMFDPAAGFFNQILTSMGFEASTWLKNPALAMPCVVIVSLWKNLGYCMLINLSGIKGIPAYLYEAAEIDGADAFQKFRSITLPMLQPTTFFLFITTCISSFNVFEQVNVLTGGGPMNKTTTIVHQIYIRGFTEFKMGYASTISVVLMFIVSIITIINFRFGNQGQDTDMG